MKNWFKNLFFSDESHEEATSHKEVDELEDILYKKRQRIREPKVENKTDIVEQQREDFIKVKKRDKLNTDIIDTLEKNGIEINQPKQSKIRQLSKRSQQLSEEVEQLGETVYRRHRSTRERSKISVENLNEEMKKTSPLPQLHQDDIFGIFPEELAQNADIIVEIDDEYIEQLTLPEVHPKNTVVASSEKEQVEETYQQLTKTRKSFMEEFGPKSDDEIPYYPKYKGHQSKSSNELHRAYQQIHRSGFKPTTHFSAINGVTETKQSSSPIRTRVVKDVEYSSTGKIAKPVDNSKITSKINGVDEPKTIAGLKQVEIKPPASSHIPTSAISVSTPKKEVEQRAKEKPKREITTPYNVLSSVEERARLRKLKRLGR